MILILGERLNSTRSRVAQALAQRDKAFLQQEARTQVEAGANILDVNAGAFVDEEPELLRWLVSIVQEAVPVPLSIDSPSPEAMAAGLEVHRGKALLNSVTAEKERLEGVLPLLKRYRPGVIALCLNQGGIPSTAEDRVRVAAELVKRLEGEGVPRQDIFLDPVILAIGVEPQSGVEVLQAISRIKEAFPGVSLICGLSNVSFGLPRRPLLNRVFLAMAMARGLDAVILDPRDTPLMNTVIAAHALLGQDEFCRGYLKAYRRGRLK